MGRQASQRSRKRLKNEKPESEMEVGEATLQETSVEVQGPKKKKKRDTCGITKKKKRKTACMKIEQSGRKKQMTLALCQVPSENREEPIIGATTDASDKVLRYMQIASMSTEESGEARTINLCKLCHNAQLVQQGKQPQVHRRYQNNRYVYGCVVGKAD